MPSKKIDKNDETRNKSRKGACCGNRNPGPGYELRPVMGYEGHCQTKYRNPAYSMGLKPKAKTMCLGPGPKYLYQYPPGPGYKFPKAVYKPFIACSPGPKYTLPGFNAPAYTIIGKPRTGCKPPGPGPYMLPPLSPGPTFVFTTGRPLNKCGLNPPIRDVGPPTLTRPRPPAYTIAGRHPASPRCLGPGPTYMPPQQKGGYTFGLKHSECSRIPRTECDDLC